MMEIGNSEKGGCSPVTEKCEPTNDRDFEILTNWKITNERLLPDTVTTVGSRQAPERTSLEDVVSLETCIRLEKSEDNTSEPCTVDIKLRNGQKIARIAVVSEACIIELYKQFGEYATTTHAEFIDEFENNAVYFAEVAISPPTPEASVKFAKLKDKGSAMWLYGIRLIITDASSKSTDKTIDYNIIDNFLQHSGRPVQKGAEMARKLLETFGREEDNGTTPDIDSCIHAFMGMNFISQRQKPGKGVDGVVPEKQNEIDCMGDTMVDTKEVDIVKYIDHKFRAVEEKLMRRVDVMERRTDEKLDMIIKLLGDRTSSNN